MRISPGKMYILTSENVLVLEDKFETAKFNTNFNYLINRRELSRFFLFSRSSPAPLTLFSHHTPISRIPDPTPHDSVGLCRIASGAPRTKPTPTSPPFPTPTGGLVASALEAAHPTRHAALPHVFNCSIWPKIAREGSQLGLHTNLLLQSELRKRV